MVCLLNVIPFDVWYIPNIRRVLSERVARYLPSKRPFKMLFVGILRRDADGVKVECIIVGFGKP